MSSPGKLTRREVLRRAAGRQVTPRRNGMVRPPLNWRSYLPRRLQVELRVAEDYARRFPAGAPATGPTRLLLIAQLAGMLDTAAGLEPGQEEAPETAREPPPWRGP